MPPSHPRSSTSNRPQDRGNTPLVRCAVAVAAVWQGWRSRAARRWPTPAARGQPWVRNENTEPTRGLRPGGAARPNVVDIQPRLVRWRLLQRPRPRRQRRLPSGWRRPRPAHRLCQQSEVTDERTFERAGTAHARNRVPSERAANVVLSRVPKSAFAFLIADIPAAG